MRVGILSSGLMGSKKIPIDFGKNSGFDILINRFDGERRP
jgi:hypothetical protein